MADQGAGRVLALQANFCLVGLDQAGPGGLRRLLCTRRSRLGKGGQRICVGDRVRVEAIDWRSGRAVIAALEPRASLLSRPAVANASRILVVASLREPEIDPLQLSRFLVTAETCCASVAVALSKSELATTDELESWCARVQGWGYAVHPISVRSGAGIEALRQALAEPGIVAVCGPSGVGKSSLLNALRPALALRTGSVSGRLQRGRHTTRHVELFELGEALVADSPGFNRPDLPGDAATLAGCFPELRRALAARSCRFRNCRHLGDPGCAMEAPWDRRDLYGLCLAELEDRPTGRGGSRPGPEPGALRQRGDRLELRLDPQLRRDSRRTARQRLAEEAGDERDPGDLSRPSPSREG